MISPRWIPSSGAAFCILLFASGCADAGPTAPEVPFPAVATPAVIESYLALVSDDIRVRVLPSFEDRVFARDVERELDLLDASLRRREHSAAVRALSASRAALDRASPGDAIDAQVIHLALDAAVALLGLPISAARFAADF